MAPTPPSPVRPAAAPSAAKRIVSIDVFRGLTMFLMLLVNDIGDADLGNIQDAPQWLRHMPANVDGLTMPDVIWPCFMFIIGLAIPIALGRRIARGDALWKLSGHVVLRSAALIFIGLCMVNGCHMTPVNEAAMGMSAPLWRLLMFLGIILLWNGYPDTKSAWKWLFLVLRLAGAALLIYLLVIYRANENGQIIWLRSRWWGIIGLIGWAYLIAGFIWLACRDQPAAVMGAMALLISLNISTQSGTLESWWQSHVNGFAPGLRDLTWLSSMAVAGMVIGTLFRPSPTAAAPRTEKTGAGPDPSRANVAKPVSRDVPVPVYPRIVWMLVFAAGFAAAGFLFWPLWGISKHAGTPSWILLSLAIACAVYALLYWLIDVMKISRWTVLVGPAGSNTLLMYFLPQIFYAALALAGITYLQTHFHEGWPGVARSAVLAVCFVALTGLLTRCRIRLQL